MSKKTKSKAKVTIEKKEDGTFDVKYIINEPNNVTEEEILKLIEFVEEVTTGTWEGF